MRFKVVLSVAVLSALTYLAFHSFKTPPNPDSQKAADQSRTTPSVPSATIQTPSAPSQTVTATVTPAVSPAQSSEAIWAQPASEPEFAAFQKWVARFQAASAADKLALEAEGVALAGTRIQKMAELIQNAPEQAIALAVPESVRSQLPPVVTALTENWVRQTGSYEVVCVTPTPAPGRFPLAPLVRHATIDGVVHRVFTFGRALDYVTRPEMPMNGIAVPMTAAVRPPTDATGRAPTFLMAMSALTAGSDAGFDTPVTPGNLPTAESTYTEGRKRYLLMRVDFPDYAGDVFPTNNALSHMTEMSNFLAAISYNKHIIAPVGKGSDITPVMRMSNPVASYDNQGLSVLYPEARTAAQNVFGYDLSKYDFFFVCTGGRPSYDYAGLGYVGGVGYHLANGYFDVRTSAHELGHNLGLGHANWWDSGNRSTIGSGNNEEYGDPFDTMGGSGGGSRHFSASQKNRLDWIPAADAITVNSSGVYRLHAHDITAAPFGVRAIRLNRPSGNPYWLEFRQLWTSNKGLMNGVNVRWASGSSQLLDMTPGSSAGKDDHSLTIGRTFSDFANNFHVTPTRKGNTYPESLDLAINFGPFPGNQPPTAVARASATTAATAQNITFTATAADPNGDTLAYFWDFGDGDYSVDNSASTTHSFAAAGEYYVEVTVSDMKGGVARDSVIVTVDNPTTFTISGRVLNHDGKPLTGVRVSTSGSRYAFSESDGTYTISRLAAGSYTVTAIDSVTDALTFASPFSSNPVTVGPDVTGFDFFVTTNPPPNLTSLVAANSTWRYLDDGSDQGTEWLDDGFIDLLWPSGPGTLGYGDSGLATTLSFGGSSQNKHLTYYFRKSFNVANPAAFANLRLRTVFDDGIVVYLNGAEIYRNNMPAGAVTYLTQASSTTDAGDYVEQTVSLANLVAGENIIAAEIHQANRTSSDIAFDLALDGVAQAAGVNYSAAYITSPSAGQVFANPASIVIAAAARSTLGTATRVDFLVDGVKIGEDTSAPFTFTWNNPTTGTHDLSVVATFGTATFTSAPTPIVVNPAPTLTVTLTSPAVDQSANLPAGLSLAASAIAGPAPVSSVQFLANGSLVGEDNIAPYTASLAETSPGTKQIIAIATDTLGNTATSAPVTVTFTQPAAGDQLVSFGDTWKYLDDGSNLGTAWRAPGFNDRNWFAGPSRLGYGGDGEVTTVSFGPNASQRYITTYFRRAFTVANPAAYSSLLLRLIRDDGAVVYLNGVEVLRDNLPSGLVNWNSLAATTIDAAGETTPVEAQINPALLIAGTNVLAVEVHQAAINSSDVGFNLALVGLETTLPAQPIYLTQPGADARFNTPAHIQLASYTSTEGDAPLSVQYYAGGILVGTGASTPPYSFTWSNAPVGAHLLTAVAVRTGGSSTSAPVEVTVDRALPSIIPVNSTLIGQNATWRYWDNALPVASGWQTRGFDDSAWQSGPARFGWGFDAENTTLTDGRITHYFRRWFSTPSTPAFYNELSFLLARDDGAVVYLNGVEIFRSNMPEGPITSSTLALNSVNTPDETTYFERVIATAGSGIVSGTNLLAVELHQSSATSSDGGFDLLLTAYGSSAGRVYLTTPAQGATFTGSSTVDIEAMAKGAGTSAVTNVEFYANGVMIAERASAPWKFSWSNAPLGVFQLTARSRDALGFSTVSDPMEIAIGREPVVTTLVQSNSTWRYSDTGSNLGTNWTRLIYPEGTWKTGVTRLGYGGDGETLPAVSFGGSSANKHITTYFRRTFVVQPGAVYTNLTFKLVRDDAAVVWLNGREQFRSNLPEAPAAITFQTLSSSSVGGADEQTFFATTVPATDLVAGTNILAVEIHQQAPDSSDLGFNLELVASGYEDAETPPSLVVFYADDLIELRWPSTAAGWQVYGSSTIDAPADAWTPVAGSLIAVGGQNVFTIAPSTGNQFFRLRKQ
jgi:hypothetical protein